MKPILGLIWPASQKVVLDSLVIHALKFDDLYFALLTSFSYYVFEKQNKNQFLHFAGLGSLWEKTF